MSGCKPLSIELTARGVPAAKFAADAVGVFHDNDRIEIEPSATGVVLRAIWELELECAVTELKEALGLEIEHGPPEILYRKESRLLEPIMRVCVTVPEDCIGEVIGDLNRRRATVQEVKGGGDGYCRIESLVPLGNIFGYFHVMQQLAKGKGKIDVDFHGYEHVPPFVPDPDPSTPAAAALRNRKAG